MKFIRKTIFAMVAMGLIAGCSSAQLTKTNAILDKVSETQCNVLSWGQPIVQTLSVAGKLDPTGQEILNDVNSIMLAGCQAGDKTALARLPDIVKAMLAIIYAPRT